MPRLLNIAHRGASAHAPENTLEAFDLALAQGADHLEFDVRVTADGHHVLSHGPAVTARGAGEIIATTGLTRLLEVLPGLVQLSEVSERYRDRVGLFLEVKDLGSDRSAMEGLAATLSAHGFAPERDDGLRDRALSFDPELLDRLAHTAPSLPLIQSFHWHYKPTDYHIARAVEVATGICVWKHLLNRRVLERARALDLETYVFTIDRTLALKRAAAMDIDGIITNVPGRLRAILDSKDRADS